MNTNQIHGVELLLPDAESQTAFGERLAAQLPLGLVIYLHGDLGTGKTTLARGILRGLGHQGPARSPTYTLIEPYEIGARRVYHLDLFRLADPEELEYLGLRDLLAEDALWLIEWPERGAAFLPAPDLTIAIDYLPQGRTLTLSAPDERGQGVIDGLRLPSIGALCEP